MMMYGIVFTANPNNWDESFEKSVSRVFLHLFFAKASSQMLVYPQKTTLIIHNTS